MKKTSRNSGTNIMLKGSFTVEAAIIMPIIIIIIALLLYLSFFIYNRCILTHVSYVSALRRSLCEEDYKSMQEVELGEKELFSNKILGAGKTQYTNEDKNKNITITANANMRVPFAAFTNQFKIKRNWNISIKKKAKKIDALQFIRNCRKLEHLLKKDT